MPEERVEPLFNSDVVNFDAERSICEVQGRGVVSLGPASTPRAVDPLFDCERCGRPIGEHRIFHDEPPPEHGMTEATFGGVDTSGFYCPKDASDG